MKLFFFFAAFFTCLVTNAQKDSAQLRKAADEATVKNYQSELNIPKEKATSLVDILQAASSQIMETGRNRKLSKEEKNVQMKRITAERSKKISELLSPEEVKRLEELLEKHKTKYKRSK